MATFGRGAPFDGMGFRSVSGRGHSEVFAGAGVAPRVYMSLINENNWVEPENFFRLPSVAMFSCTFIFYEQFDIWSSTVRKPNLNEENQTRARDVMSCRER